jgi:hypothetical protein
VRLTKIEFHGYKRLADTACNVDGRLVAFLGPNEAGKSSILEALRWLSDTESGELEGRFRSRALGPLPPSQRIITVQFALDDDDRAALADLDTDDRPRYYIRSKRADGKYVTTTEPALTRRRTALEEAAVALAGARLGEPVRTKTENGPGDHLLRIAEALDAPDTAPDEEAVESFAAFTAWLRQPIEEPAEDEDAEPTSYVEPAHERAADLLDTALAKLQEPSPADVARDRLAGRRPEFLMFDEPDRVLASTYSLADRALLADPPPALRNLLALAGTTLREIAVTQASGDTSRLRTLLKRCNLALRKRIDATWKQSKLALQLGVDADVLNVLIEEIDDQGAITPIEERSDGLRAFVALLCFLADKESGASVPPVLLIDEAETHLHYDAQADLIDVLLNHVKTSKVIYTTHSPGCLPPDLGTGIRLVARDPANAAASKLKAEFWHNEQPGFSPLLFAMGAGAAAFSVCRRAVVAEGPSDMILLPSLLRKATDLPELNYQVAPGLAVGAAELGTADIAAHVAYLADGDGEGRKYHDRLVAAGAPPKRVHRLPDGAAVEDLLTPDSWLAAVRTLMAEAGYAGNPVTLRDLRGRRPIAKRLEDWGKKNRIATPGKTIVASHLVQDSDRIVLTAGATKALRTLHKKFTAELGS